MLALFLDLVCFLKLGFFFSYNFPSVGQMVIGSNVSLSFLPLSNGAINTYTTDNELTHCMTHSRCFIMFSSYLKPALFHWVWVAGMVWSWLTIKICMNLWRVEADQWKWRSMLWSPLIIFYHLEKCVLHIASVRKNIFIKVLDRKISIWLRNELCIHRTGWRLNFLW